MIVFTRLENESVIIGEQVRVTVLEIQDNSVRLGITDPDHVPSYREQTIFIEADAVTSSEVQEYQFS